MRTYVKSRIRVEALKLNREFFTLKILHYFTVYFLSGYLLVYLYLNEKLSYVFINFAALFAV